jgi:5-methylcytosine-specific restriction endonuclease McrA
MSARKINNWARLADDMDLARDRVVAVACCLNAQYSVPMVARILGLHEATVQVIADRVRPLVRQPKRKSVKTTLINRDGFKCQYCGSEDRDLTVDHVTPRARGGANGLSNLALACRSCNSAKGDRTPEEWLS